MKREFPSGTEAYFSQAQKKRQRRRAYLGIVGTVVVVYGLVLLLAWFVIGSRAFRIKTIVVEGNQAVSSEEVVEAVRASMKQGKRFRFFLMHNMLNWPSRLAGEELKLAPALAEVALRKDYIARTITISVKEQKAYGIWCRASAEPPQCFWFNEEGMLFRRSSNAEGSLVRVLHDYSSRGIGLRDKILPDKLLRNLYSIFDALSKSRVAIKEMRLDDIGLEEIQASTYNGPRLHFSLRFSANAAAAAINALRDSPGLQKLEYIDFRVENRVFYK